VDAAGELLPLLIWNDEERRAVFPPLRHERCGCRLHPGHLPDRA
jgi:hypothetical protein